MNRKDHLNHVDQKKRKERLPHNLTTQRCTSSGVFTCVRPQGCLQAPTWDHTLSNALPCNRQTPLRSRPGSHSRPTCGQDSFPGVRAGDRGTSSVDAELSTWELGCSWIWEPKATFVTKAKCNKCHSSGCSSLVKSLYWYKYTYA